MTRITTTPLAVSADYRDALVAARRAKSWLFLVLLLFLLAQITIFFLVKFDVVKMGEGGQATTTVPTTGVDVDADVEMPATTDEDLTNAETPTTAPSLMAVAAAGGEADVSLNVGTKDVTNTVLAWVVNSVVYLATIFSILMAVVILLIVLIMLVGRFEGTSSSTSAFVWMALLALLLFPWQLCYGPETSASGGSTSSSASAYDAGMDDFRVPGALYTWGELRRDGKFANEPVAYAVQKWARFAGFPVLALLILFAVQAKSGRAVKLALGEAEVHVDVATTEM